ncbi:hypothetical protein ACXR2U_01810 [Jatrophihabitans sp. YIM 134969]
MPHHRVEPDERPPPTARAPRIWAADAARALDALQPDAETTAEILRVLGLQSTLAASGPIPPAPARAAAVPGPSAPRRPSSAAAVRVEPSTPAGEPAPVRTPATVDELPTRSPATSPVRLPELAEVLRPPVAPSTLPASDLLAPSRQRAVVGAVVSARAPSGELDVAAIVDALVVGRPLVSLPQLTRTTTRRGLQLLVDLGPSMTPFDRDQRRIRRTVEQIAGPDGLQVLRFRGSPLAEPGAGRGPIWGWRPYRPPTTPRPIVVLSDLGLLTPDGFNPDWQRFVRLCHEARCPVVALVPVPPHRVPAAVRRVLAVVHWDRATTVRDCAIAARRAARTERSRS